MTCKNCGAELRPGALFCPACGADAVPAPFLDTDPVPGADRKKKEGKKRGGRIALIVLLVLLAAAGTVFHRVIGEFFLRTFTSPARYYQHVEARVIDDLSERIGKAYARAFLPEDGRTGRTLELAVTPETDALSWIEGLRLTGTLQTDADAALAQAELELNGEPLAAVKLFSGADCAALQIPLLNKDYFALEDDAAGAVAFAQALRASGLSQEAVTALTKKTLTCFVQGLDDVTKSRGAVTVGEISQRCTALQVTVTAEDASEIRDALETLWRSDADAQTLLKAYAAACGADADDCAGELAAALVEALADDGAEMRVSVSAAGDVIGREVRFGSGALYACARPASFAKRAAGLELRVLDADASGFSLSGTLEKDAGALTCTLSGDGKETRLCDLTYTDLQRSGDAVSADFSVEFDEGMQLVLGKSGTALLAKSLRAEGAFSADSDRLEANAALQALGAEVAAVTLTQERVESEPFDAVDDAVTLSEWRKDADYLSAVSQLTKSLRKAGVDGDAVRSLLMQLVTQFFSVKL